MFIINLVHKNMNLSNVIWLQNMNV